MEASFASAIQQQRVRQGRATFRNSVDVFTSPVAIALYVAILAAVVLLLIKPPFVTANDKQSVSLIRVAVGALIAGVLAFALPWLFTKLSSSRGSRSQPR